MNFNASHLNSISGSFFSFESRETFSIYRLGAIFYTVICIPVPFIFRQTVYYANLELNVHRTFRIKFILRTQGEIKGIFD